MTRFSRAAMSIAALALATAIGSPPRAAFAEGDNLSMAHGLICDTAEEVEAFVALDPEERVDIALSTINERFGRGACGIATTIFRAGERGNTIMIPQGVVRIVRVEVVGILIGQGVRRLDAPKTQYAPIFEKADAV